MLLGLKKRGFGKDLWNGFGGKVEKNETITEGALRELKEECGITAINHFFIALMHFYIDDLELWVHVFKSHEYSGDI